MEYHYKAFISYRHDPADSRIAAEIQTQVERYRLPYSVRKEKGIKSVGTVFRDKEELSAGSDLNENIQWALLHSEYLIVICSKHLKDSLWCQKEIEFFLAHRDHRHVTTVLVDGEPQDVIPKILQEEKILTEDADGNPVEVTVPLEPLSCDYRMPIRRARREELPRLIAVLTGIRYGELMQRQKKRQRRLLAAAAAAAAVLIAYLSWSLVNIRAGYRRTQISESLSMADDALKSIEDNNHLEALKTSLGAVPTQEAPRPFVPEAQYALSRSLHSYEAPSYISSSDVARFEFDGRITDGLTNEDGSLVMVFETAHSRLTFLNVKDRSEIGQIPCKQLSGSLYLGENRALVYNQSEVSAVNMEDGSILWTQYFDDWVFSCSYAPKGDSLLITTRSDLIVMAADGSRITGRFPFSSYPVGSEARIGTDRTFCASPDGARYYYLVDSGDSFTSSTFTGVLTYDVSKGTMAYTPIEPVLSLLGSVCADDLGNLYLSGFESEEDEAFSISLDYSAVPFYSVSHGHYTAAAFRAADGSLLWKSRLPYQSAAQSEAVPELFLIQPKDRSAGAKTDGADASPVLLSFVSSRADMLDPETGALLLSYDLGSELASPIEGNAGVFLTDKGNEVFLSSTDTGTISVMESFPPDMARAKRIFEDASYSGKIQTFLFGQNAVLLFERGQGDSNWKPFASAGREGAEPAPAEAVPFSSGSAVYAHYTGDRYAAFATDEGRITVCDLKARTLCASLTGLDYLPDLYGFSKDGGSLYYAPDIPYDSPAEDMLSVCSYTAETGTTKKLSLFPEDLAGRTTGVHFLKYADQSGRMLCEAEISPDGGAYTDPKWFFARADMESGEVVLIPSPSGFYSFDFYNSDDGAYGLAVFSGISEDQATDTCCLLDFERGTAVTCPEMPSAIQTAVWNGSDGSVIVMPQSDRSMHLFDRDGRLRTEVWYDGTFLISGAVRDGRLYALHQDGVLSVYDAGTLSLLQNIDVESSETKDTGISSETPVSWQFTADGFLFLTIGDALYEIDPAESGLVGKAPVCLGYSEAENLLLIPDYYDGQIGYCPRLSLNDLIEKGRSVLSDAEKH